MSTVDNLSDCPTLAQRTIGFSSLLLATIIMDKFDQQIFLCLTFQKKDILAQSYATEMFLENLADAAIGLNGDEEDDKEDEKHPASL